MMNQTDQLASAPRLIPKQVRDDGFERTPGRRDGQALIPVIFIISVAIVLGLSFINVNILGSRNALLTIQGTYAYYYSESALEEGLLKLLRNPNYVGESLQLNSTPCTITITGSFPSQTMTASCTYQNKRRQLRADINYVSGIMQVSNVHEVQEP